MFDIIKNDITSRMDSSIQSFKSDMQGIRAGRASPGMLDSIKIDAYGQKMNINQLGNITTPDPRTISIDIWDSANISLVEKALRESDLGINPMIEGNLIRSAADSQYKKIEDRAMEMVKNDDRPLKIINTFENKSAAVVRLSSFCLLYTSDAADD